MLAALHMHIVQLWKPAAVPLLQIGGTTKKWPRGEKRLTVR